MGLRSTLVTAMLAVFHRNESFLPLPIFKGDTERNMPPPPQLSLPAHTQTFFENSCGHVLAPQ